MLGEDTKTLSFSPYLILSISSIVIFYNKQGNVNKCFPGFLRHSRILLKLRRDLWETLINSWSLRIMRDIDLRLVSEEGSVLWD
jgi:hypothetical protein